MTIHEKHIADAPNWPGWGSTFGDYYMLKFVTRMGSTVYGISYGSPISNVTLSQRDELGIKRGDIIYKEMAVDWDDIRRITRWIKDNLPELAMLSVL